MIIALAVKMTEVQIHIEQRFVLGFLRSYILFSFLFFLFPDFYFFIFLPLEYFILETVITLKASVFPQTLAYVY